MEIRGLSKAFGHSWVLDDVDLDLHAGEVHMLVGQNGSGKSTLIKILSGTHPADSGAITVNGEQLPTPVTAAALRRAGLAFVHQDLGLVPDLTVLENIRVGRYEPHGVLRRVRWRDERACAQHALDRLNAGVSVDTRVQDLSAGQRALVAIARALQGEQAAGGCIVFDESTQSLPRETLPDFYATVRALARAGCAVLVVTHRLEEALELGDVVTVIRDGSLVRARLPVAGLTQQALSHLILGRELEQLPAPSARPDRRRPGAPAAALHVTGLSSATLRSVEIRVHHGEIVGITGPAGSGHDEVPYILAGIRPDSGGTLAIGDRAVDMTSARAVRAAGLVLVPQHRLDEGLAGDLSALENLTLPRVSGRRRPVLGRRWQRQEFSRAVERLGLQPPRPHAAVTTYSGGNQQKILLAKWLADHPAVLVVHEPTQAVDVGARTEIIRALRDAASAGTAILVSSVERSDLAHLCDRVLVLRDGAVRTELLTGITAEAIADAAYK